MVIWNIYQLIFINSLVILSALPIYLSPSSTTGSLCLVPETQGMMPFFDHIAMTTMVLQAEVKVAILVFNIVPLQFD